VRAAPFKAQNMALNSSVTAGGAEIGRAQAAQAQAAGVEPEAAMNPILIKPSGERYSQVMLMGRPLADVDARSYQELKPELLPVVLDALETLRSRFDVVVCEGAGSPAEINLRHDDLTNMGLARAAGLPVVLVGDIDRGGVFASLLGTLALLDANDQRLHALEVAVVRLRWMSNFTDFDGLAAEPGVSVRFTQSATDVERADLVILPGTKATVEDLTWLHERALDAALVRRARAGGPLLGICGGYQMLGGAIRDEVESRAGAVAGLGLLPVDTEFGPDKLIARCRGRAPAFGGHTVEGFELHHGRVRARGGRPLFEASTRGGEGCRRGAVLGTSWHGVLESDGFRRALLSWVAAIRRRRWTPGHEPFAAVRERRLDTLGDLVERHADTGSLLALIERGPARDLPAVAAAVPA
jgi:adenosylcobyric acid synthase